MSDSSLTIESLIDRIGFTNYEFIKRDSVKRFFIVRGLFKGKEAILKISPKDNSGKIRSLLKEYAVDQLILESNKDYGTNCPRIEVVDKGENEEFVWIIRKYYAGKTLGVYQSGERPQAVLDSYDKLDDIYIDQVDKLLPKIVLSVESFHGLKVLEGSSEKISQPRFPILLNQNHITEIEDSYRFHVKDQTNFYQSCQEEYLGPDRLGMGTGDLIPPNIIVTYDERVLLTDFEWACLDNKFMDYSYFFLYLWQYPNWQKELVELTVKNEADERDFRCSIIRQIIGFGFPEKFIDKNWNGGVDEHIWVRYLKAAGESFEAVMKVK